MTTKTYIAIAAVAIIIAAFLGASFWSEHKLAKQKHRLEELKRNADAAEARSRELELSAAEYKQKIEYLEGSLSDIERIASKQDEEIKLLETDTNNTRRDAGRARGVERVTSTAAELCRKLAELDHPCE